uniref:Uncharacterized protein n=1 Tax=Parascaris univalens TaxID=6257 RepID=A0A914ZSE3_PARUN
MRRGYLSVPQMPGKGAYEVLTDGPIAIWHFLANREYRGRKRYAFQIYREAVPLCFLTMKHLSYVVMQSDVPIFVPKHMHVIVEFRQKFPTLIHYERRNELFIHGNDLTVSAAKQLI